MKRKKVNKHKFNLGGLANTTGWNQIPLTGPSATPLNLGQTLKTSLGGVGNMLGGLADVGVTAFNSIINPSGNSTKVGNFLSATGSTISKVPGLNFIGAGVNALGGLWNAAFGSNLNEDFINQTEANIKAQNNYVSKATNTTDLLYDWVNHSDLDLVSQDDVGSDGWFSDKAKDKTNELNQETIDANARAKASLANTNNNIRTNQYLTALSNYRANGGPLSLKHNRAILPIGTRFEDGGDLDFIDNWNRERLSTGRFDAQLGNGNLELQRNNKDTTPIFSSSRAAISHSANKANPFVEGMDLNKRMLSVKATMDKISKQQSNNTKGFYIPGAIYVNKEYSEIDPTIITHEKAHASQANPQEAKISEIYGTSNESPYLLRPTEIYSRLMQFRESNNISPNKIFTKEDLSNYKNNDYQLFDLGTEDQTLKLLNEVAYNPNEVDNLSYNIAANGGPIHIKKANRGKFTKYCGGEVTSECIARGKRSSDPAVRKRAVFADNARGFKHAFGGDLLTNGVEWSNGLKTINNGGTHEENPFEGVQMGIAPDGLPNLVEEGEVIFNDYVFSNRMTANKDLLEKFKLPKSYDGYSFAAIAEKLSKESKERPNDPISKRGLISSMTRLQQAQETMRQKSQVGQEGKEYAHGGKMGILFDGLGDYPNSLGDWQDFGVLDTPITVDELESMMSKPSNPVNKNRGTNKLTYLRYAPILGSAIGLGYNLFKKPDYSGPDAILEAAEQVGNYTPVDYTPIGNYLTYKPLDRDYYTNKLNAQSGATRRAILNTTSPSRNAALLAADYNAQTKLGDLFRQAEEYNLAQRERVEGFNRQTNMANSEMGLKASMANQEATLKAKSQRLSGVAQAMAMRDTIDSRRGASISANLTNLFDSLGSVGKEEFIKDMIENNSSLLYNWMGTYKDKKKSKGGYLTIKKRGK